MVLRKRPTFLFAPVTAALILVAAGPARPAGVSAATEECLGCHKYDKLFDSRLWRREYGVSDA